MKFKTFAIDFDGTIVDNDVPFPEIGKLKPNAKKVINRIRDNGGQVAIWTCRDGEHAEAVKNKLSDYGVEYDSFNSVLPCEREKWGEGGRKIYADVYIDDHGLYAMMNGGIDWEQIEEFIFGCPMCGGEGVVNIATNGKLLVPCFCQHK